MKQPATFTRNRGMNRGKPRLWIEGKHLLEAGFNPGDRWNAIQTASGLNMVKHPEGSRKVSGKGARPIIDITGANLGRLQSVAVVKLTYTPGAGTIRAEEFEQ